jgi:hypothetical protein
MLNEWRQRDKLYPEDACSRIISILKEEATDRFCPEYEGNRIDSILKMEVVEYTIVTVE